MNLEDRVSFLEKEYEHLFHESELLYNEIIRLIGIMNILNKPVWERRGYMTTGLKVLSEEMSIYNKELLQHFKAHYLDKKKKEEFVFKRKRTRY